MKILFVVETINYGVGRNLRDNVEGLLDRGHEVTVIWSKKRTGEVFVEWLTSCAHPAFYQRQIHMARSPSLSDLTAIYNVLTFIRSHGVFDVIHGMSSKGGAIARIVGLFAGISAFYSPHAYVLSDPEMGSIKYLSYFWVEKLLSWKAGVICTSKDELEITERLGIKKHYYIPNGIDLTQRYSKDPKREFCVSFVGRLSHQKDPLKFISIVRNLAHLPLKFNVFGDGELMAETQNAIPLDIRSKVQFWGVTDLETIWKNTNVLICTSRYEGCPYIFLDAMNHGAPVISTPVGGAAEVIINDNVGLILNDADSEVDLELFISRLLKDKNYYKESRQACIENAKRFSRDTMLQSLLEFYQS